MYIVSTEAQADIDAIWEYLALRNHDAADRALGVLERAFEALAGHPEMGHRRPDLTERPVRFWTTRNVTVVYHAERRPIEIVRVLTRGRDVGSILG